MGRFLDWLHDKICPCNVEDEPVVIKGIDIFSSIIDEIPDFQREYLDDVMRHRLRDYNDGAWIKKKEEQ